MEIADRLRSARRSAGYKTTAKAIRRFGWVKSTTYCHENGLRGLPSDELEKYARAYRVSIDWLLTGKGETKTLNADYDALPPDLKRIADKIIHGLLVAFERG